ncbi:MAG: DUF835 domain-containing protein [Thermoplasmata archaeon]|uniref:DUF835 domain-containing protein n=2 Tax=Candidatus Sysuiplasma superficiale TaxID=2823368 RepID=A0A8J7YRV5_9ARCH|nr:DUF835 domain-containing protein [Candidatus Sysuiplasma superficiale]
MTPLNIIAIASIRMPVIVQKQKEPLLEFDSHRIMRGEAYLVEETKPRLFFEFCSEASLQDIKVLLITREFPERIRNDYSLENASVIWLTHVIGRDYIEPTQTNLILKRIVSFAKENSPSMIMLDGVEYLINQNNFDLVIGFLNHVRDLVIIRDAVLVVSIDPDTLERRELALVERGMNVIKSIPSEERKGAVLTLESGTIRVMRSPNSKI